MSRIAGSGIALWVKAVFVLLLAFAAFPAFSATAAQHEIEFLRYEYSKVVDGKKCLSMHFRIKVSGLKGEDVKVTAYIESPKGTGVPDRNGKYCTKGGEVSVSKTDDATYEVTSWGNFTLNIPNEEIHALPGKNTYYVEALLRHNNTVLARTYCEPFTMTGASESSGREVRNNGGYHVVKKWMENGSRYGFVETTLYSNGSKKRCFYGRCPNCRGTSMCGMCNGTGICGFCNGQGGHYLSAMGYWNPCTLCGQTGRCSHCAGNGGKCTLCNGQFGREHPGYVCNSIQIVFPDGRSISERVGYQWVTDRWKDSHEVERKGTCSNCGGTGVEPRSLSDCPRHEWIADFIETGQICPYCHYVGPHWHRRCSQCNIPTHY